MKLASFEAIVRALNEAGVRYLIAGGLAVNAHGYLRCTQDRKPRTVLAIATIFSICAGYGRREPR